MLNDIIIVKTLVYKNMKNKLLNDPKVAMYLYFKYSKNTPWITSEELVNRVKRYIYGKD